MCTGAELDSLAQRDSKCHARINVAWLEYVNIKPSLFGTNLMATMAVNSETFSATLVTNAK